MSLPLVGVIFSRDRAMQLDAALRSFYLHCAGAGDFPLAVLYRASPGLHAGQYAALAAEWAAQPNLRFIPEAHFWSNLIGWIAHPVAGITDPGYRDDPGYSAGRVYTRLLRLGHRFSFLRRPALRRLLAGPERYVLFLVDDTLFVRDFRLADALAALAAQPQALGFSLRLGANTTHSYALDRPQPLPAFTPIGLPVGQAFSLTDPRAGRSVGQAKSLTYKSAPPSILTYDWTQAELDFAYPLEVSSSIYRLADLLPFLDTQPFANPNQLESRLADSADIFRSRPQLLCYVRSAAFCAPLNRVNPEYKNRAGDNPDYSIASLAGQFDRGLRLDVAALSDFVPHACHQEIEPVFHPATVLSAAPTVARPRASARRRAK